MENVLEALPGVKRSGRGWSARCPAHDDRSPSLSVGHGDKGRVLLKCHARCTTEAVCAALGLEVKDLFDENPPRVAQARQTPAPSRGRSRSAIVQSYVKGLGSNGGQWGLAGSWSYTDAEGAPVMEVLRFGLDGGTKKEYRPISPAVGGWASEAPPKPYPLFGLPHLTGSGPVFVVEGEKAAERAQQLGLCVTTSAFGSSAASRTDWTPLAGRDVVVLPDADSAGSRYADEVARLLTGLSPRARVKVLHLPGLEDGEDIVEFAEAVAAPGTSDVEIGKQVLALAQQVEVVAGERGFEGGADGAGVRELPDGLRCYQPFPTEALPPAARDLAVRGAKAIGCDPGFIALPALAVMAAAIGNARVIEVKEGWQEPSVIWAVIVGKSGSQKSPALDLATEPLKDLSLARLAAHERASREYQEAPADYEDEVSAWRSDKSRGARPEKLCEPVCQRLMTQDATVEALAVLLQASPFGVALVSDELSAWFGSLDAYKATKGGDMAHYLTMFGARGIIVDRKGTKLRPIIVPKASLSIIGGIQPGVLNRVLGREHRESGASARFLVAAPPARTKQWTDEVVPARVRHRWHALVEGLVELRTGVETEPEAQPQVVRLSAGAKTAWVAFYNEHAEAMQERDDEAAAAFAKLEGYVPRIALVFHHAYVVDEAEVDPELVSERCMKDAIRVVLWFRDEVERVQAMLAEDSHAKELRDVLDLVQEEGGRLTPRTLMHRKSRYREGADEAKKPLDALVARNVLVLHRGRSGPKGGRPTETYCLPHLGCVEEPGNETTQQEAAIGLRYCDDDLDPGSEAKRIQAASQPPLPMESASAWGLPASIPFEPVTVTELGLEPMAGCFVTPAATRGPIHGRAVRGLVQ
ncbi:MAG: DUF3987 domain-containing protein [Planctomycetota bacterium]|nr:DUF3987 domain-containing protein [Planctomycetota bacterium]